MKAEKMAKKCGYDIKLSKNEIRFEIKNDYTEKSITIRKDIKVVDIYQSNWIPKNNIWTPQGKNKHSAYYGHWQADSIVTLGVEELQAITQQFKELEGNYGGKRRCLEI